MVSRRKSDEWRKPDRKAAARRARQRAPETYVPDRSDISRGAAGPTGEINALLSAVMDTRKQDGKTYLVFRRSTTLVLSSATMLRQMMGNAQVGEDDGGNMLVEAGKFIAYCNNKLTSCPNAAIAQRMDDLMQQLNISPQIHAGH